MSFCGTTSWTRGTSSCPRRPSGSATSIGFAGGGPVYIPKLYDGRNRTFWFVNFEQQKEPLGAATTIFVPTEAQLGGDFSRLLARDPRSAERISPSQTTAFRRAGWIRWRLTS